MHERSLVAGLIDQIDEELRIRQLSGLSEVKLAVGEFAGVEPSLLELAFQEMSSEHFPDVVQLKLEIVPLTARCRQCHVEFHVDRFRFVCPQCHHGDVQVTAGADLQLVSLTASGPQSPESVFA